MGNRPTKVLESARRASSRGREEVRSPLRGDEAVLAAAVVGMFRINSGRVSLEDFLTALSRLL